jgi:hypothetical protein
MAVPNVSEIIATTIDHRSKKIADNVTKNNPLLRWLEKRGNIRTFSGGIEIMEELQFAENSTAGYYSGYDVLPTTPQEVISAAKYGIKQIAVSVSISGLEELQNAGEEQQIDLYEGRVKNAEASMANLIEDGLFSDGTGAGGKELTGLDAAVPQDPTTGTYGGINRATWTFWRPQLYDPSSTPTSSTIQQAMNRLYAACTRGSDYPNLIVLGGTLWETYTASLQVLQRFTDAEMANLGFPTQKFFGSDVVLGGGIGGFATATDGYFLNTKYLHWRPHKERNMRALKKRQPWNQDAEGTFLAFAGNLTCSGSRFQGRLKGD